MYPEKPNKSHSDYSDNSGYIHLCKEAELSGK